MGILERLRTTKVKERLAVSSRQFWEFPLRTKVTAGAVGFGLVLVLILALLPGCSPGEKSLTKEQAIAILLDEVVQPETVDHYVIAFTLDEPLPEDSEVSPYAPNPLPDNVKTLPYLVPETLATAQWFFWVDDAPFARFAHPTRFVFIDVASGAVRVQEEAWWPYVDGQPVSQWITAEGRWDAKNQAFNNIPEEERPYQVSVILESSQPGRYTLLSSIVPTLTPAPAQAGLSGEAIIPVNGWKPGRGTDAGFTEDMGNMAGFGNAASIPKYDPRGETLQDIEDAIQRAVDGGADDIFFYFTGHGGRTVGGESFLAFKDTTISPQQLVDMLKKFPKVRFKVVIDACFSGGFVDTLRDSGMVDIVLTSSSATESSYGDWDPANDPNKGDTGGEYSSGLWEDLNEIQNSPELQKQAKQIAEEKGWTEFVAWLTIADISAKQKDASAINGDTHPQSFVSTPSPTTTPPPPPPPPTPPKQVVFVSDRDEPGNWDIYTMELSTGAIDRLTFDPAIDNHPDLSPDGSRIVFSSTRGAGVDFDIYIADVSNIDGTAIRLTNDSYPNGPQAHYPDRHPHFSSDGTLIVFDSKNRPFEYEIKIVSECSVPTIIETDIRFYENLNVIRIDAAGNLVSYVELDIRDAWDSVTYPNIWVDDTATYIGHPSFSPDGSRIIFTAAIDGDGTVWEVYTVEIEIVSLSLVSDSLRRITNGSDYPPNINPIQMSGGAHFAAGGSKILFSSTRTQQGNSQLFWVYADEIDQPVQESRQLTSHLANDYVPEPLDDGRVVFVSDRGTPSLCDLPPDVEGPSMDLDLFIMNPDGSAQTNLSDNDDADEMLLIGDEVSWFCGLKPNLASCTYQPRIFNLEALWLTRYADTMIPLDLLQRFNILYAPPLYNTYWNNLEEYVITQPHLQGDWNDILEGTEFLMTTFPGFDSELVLQGWMTETAEIRDQLFVLPSIMHEDGIGRPPPEIPASGSGAASVSIFTNPGGHPSLMPGTLELTWNITGSTITIGGVPGVGELTGTLGDGGFFFATGNGTYAGYSTSFRIDGTITPDGISGTLNIGSDGGLPGGAAIVYEIELTFP